VDGSGDGSDRGGGVLVADNNAPLREFVRAVLERAGYAVRAAGNGATALWLMREARPALLLLDLGRPGSDGRRLLAAYHRGAGPHAPVVLMTGAWDTAAAAAAVGAAGHLRKPFGMAELLAGVGHYVLPLAQTPDARA
jgi:CheY-like chemotaxis protein